MKSLLKTVSASDDKGNLIILSPAKIRIRRHKKMKKLSERISEKNINEIISQWDKTIEDLVK